MANVNSKEHLFAVVQNPKTGQLEKREIIRTSTDYKLRDKMKNHIETEIRRNKRFEGKS